MQNQVDYKNGADINTSPDVESELLYGKGRAYGAEFFIKKKTGKFTGWLSYTLAKTERQIEGINDGNWYNAKQDRTNLNQPCLRRRDATDRLRVRSAQGVLKYTLTGQRHILSNPMVLTAIAGSKCLNYPMQV